MGLIKKKLMKNPKTDLNKKSSDQGLKVGSKVLSQNKVLKQT